MADLRKLRGWVDLLEQYVKHMEIHMQVYGPIQDIRQREHDHECRQSCNGSKE